MYVKYGLPSVSHALYVEQSTSKCEKLYDEFKSNNEASKSSSSLQIRSLNPTGERHSGLDAALKFIC